VADEKRPETAVAFDYATLLDQLRDIGLAVDHEIRGDWRVRSSHGQDTLILVHRQ
jgi:hypothetical protein